MNTVEFGSLFHFIRNGMNIKQDKSGEGLPITRIETIADARVDSSRVGYAGLKESDCLDWIMEPGDILFSHINSVEHIGKCAVYNGTPEKLVHGMNLLCLRCDTDKLFPDFAKYLIRSPAFRGRLSNFINKAVNQASVSISNLKKIPVSAPLLEDQKRIADILDRAEALRAKRRAAVAQLDELSRSIFIDMFGAPSLNPKGWSCNKLGELIVTGPQNGLYKPASDYGSGVPILRIDTFYDGRVRKLSTLKRLRVSEEELNQYKLIPGDIVINRVNSMEYLGKSAIIPELDEPIVFESNMMRFSVDQSKIKPQYLVQFLQTSFVKGQIFNSAKHAVNQSSINQKDVKSFQVNVPPLPLQKEFSHRIEAVEKLKAEHEASLAELDELFASLQYRAFRGELGMIPKTTEQSFEGVKI